MASIGRRVLLGLAAFALPVSGFLLLFLLGQAIEHSWQGGLFLAYAVIGAFSLVATLLGWRDPRKSAIEVELERVAARLTPRRALARIFSIRLHFANFLQDLSEIISWPARFFGFAHAFQTMNGSNFTDNLLRLHAGKHKLHLALYATAVAACAYVLSHAGIDGGGYGGWFLAAALAALSLRHTSYVLAPRSFADDIRIEASSPRLQFTAVLILELSALALLLPVVAYGLEPRDVTLPDIWHGLTALYRHNEWRAIWDGADAARGPLVSSIVGLAFDLGVLGALVGGLTSQKSDEDYSQLATRQLERGEFEEASKTLDQIESPDLNSLVAESVARVAEHDHAGAQRACRLCLESMKIDPSTDLVFGFLFAGSLGLRVPRDAYKDLLVAAARQGTSDVCLIGGLLKGFNQYGEELLDTTMFLQDYDSTQFQNCYPITSEVVYRVFERNGADFAEHIASLRRTATYEPGIHRFGFLTLVDLFTEGFYPDRGPFLPSYFEPRAAEIETIAATLNRVDDLVLAIGCLNLATDSPTRYAPHQFERLVKLRSSIAERLASSRVPQVVREALGTL
jgi:hypothetical protein